MPYVFTMNQYITWKGNHQLIVVIGYFDFLTSKETLGALIKVKTVFPGIGFPLSKRSWDLQDFTVSQKYATGAQFSKLKMFAHGSFYSRESFWPLKLYDIKITKVTGSGNALINGIIPDLYQVITFINVDVWYKISKTKSKTPKWLLLNI